MVAPIQIGAGINVGAGINIGNGNVTPPLGGITYAEMNPPIVPGVQLEDPSANVTAGVGFTLNLIGGPGNTGVAVDGLTIDNQTYYNNLGTGYFTATYGPGSTYNTSSVQITNIPATSAGSLVFFIDPGLTYPATFNFPITIS